mmetsp:Transcript_26562/g.75021  ORF Transcript_26562/g.75021 Transcript_26562/m.75021 type:complete len:174 (-) Transcript_26562:143-664(-)
MAEVVDPELRRKWDTFVEQGEQRARRHDAELDAVEAELYAHVAERRHWPPGTEDPRRESEQVTSWREAAWAPGLHETRLSGTKAETVGARGDEGVAGHLPAKGSAAEDLGVKAFEDELAADMARLRAAREEKAERDPLKDLRAEESELKAFEAELKADIERLQLRAGSRPESD